MNSKLAVGDTVEVAIHRPLRDTEWILSIIEFINSTQIGVRSLRQPFDAEGHMWISLQLSDRNRGWR